MADIIIDEEYITALKDFVSCQGEQFETFLTEYITILMQTKTDGITKGKTADALRNYIQIASALKNHIGNTSELAKQLLENYTNDIDEADSYLY